MSAEEKNSHSRWLRLLAKEIREEGHPGWVHTVEFAADEIDKLVREAHQLRLDLAQQTANAKTLIEQQTEIELVRAVLEPAKNWFSSIDDTRCTQAAIDKFRDAARSALDVTGNVSTNEGD